MGIFENEYLWENLWTVSTAGVIAFIIALIVTPFVGKLAKYVGAVDLPSHLRNGGDRTNKTRLHTKITPRWGGLAVLIAFFGGMLFVDYGGVLSPGIVIGFLIITVFGLLDDKFEIPGPVMLLGQLGAAFTVIFGGDSIREISMFGQEISFDLFTHVFTINEFAGIGPYIYEFSFPADILTLIWIVGLINAVNWMSAIDGLNLSVSSVFAGTIMLIVLGQSQMVNDGYTNLALATVIAVYIGSLLGVLPYNWNPAHIFPGAAEFMNGYMLAVFAILGSSRWSATLVILALPIIDAGVVLTRRLIKHPQARRNPLKLLSISDKNHLHHKLLDAGYSKKTALGIYISFALLFSVLAIFLQGDIRLDFVLLFAGIAACFGVFTLTSYLKERGQKIRHLRVLRQREEEARKAEVRVVLDGSARVRQKEEKEEEDYEKFVY